jgi:hypothetical protein
MLTTQPDLFEPPQFVPFHGFDRTHTVVDIDYSATTIGAGHTPGRIRQDFLFGGPYSASQYNEIANGPLAIAVGIPASVGAGYVAAAVGRLAVAYGPYVATRARAYTHLGLQGFAEIQGFYHGNLMLDTYGAQLLSAYVRRYSVSPAPRALPVELVVP